ncbi:chloride channel protein [Caenispirillum bisanense]|uniref:Chloride channel protein, CIC family n=1 Tax=Caenispirillum bisanense TaxID=414052 RepID=A0A286G056_9PROT|nr:chloride channel protein [Caenispirillum bisanense]SOD88883.1 chloride channel protein, CIC family [Caenispirillum bisanense]
MQKLRPSRLLFHVRRIVRNDQLVLGVLALVVGVAVGAGVIGFRELIRVVQALYYGSGDERLASVVVGLPWWHIVLAPVVGGLVVGLFYRLLMPGRRPLGIPEVIESAALKGGRMPVVPGIMAVVGAALSLGAGASVGREGPAVTLGAAMSAWLAERLHFGRSLSRVLLGCGTAAAVAASFNAPIAGVLFAHEVVVGHYALSAFAPVVIASVTGTMISRGWFGDYPAFIIPAFRDIHVLEFPAFAGLGVLSGIMALLFMHSILWSERLANRTGLPQWSRPPVAGVALGVLALAYPGVLGVGYEVTDDALHGDLPFLLLAALAAAKLAATALSLGFGFGGGVFSPSLAFGALVGGAFGVLATNAFPELSTGPGAYALVGMGAVSAAVLGAPISTVLIIFELTGDYGLTIAVMIAVVISTVVTTQIGGRSSWFHWALERRGLKVQQHDVRLLRSLRVRDVMAPECATVGPECRLPLVREKLQRTPYGELFVVEAQSGRFVGTITLADLSDIAFDPALDDLVNAFDVCRRNPPLLEADDSLERALKVMLEVKEEHVAVVAHEETRRFVGCVHEAEALLAFNRALMAAQAEDRGERRDLPPF